MLTTRRLRLGAVFTAASSAAASWGVVTQLAGVHLGVRFPHSSATTVALGTTVAAATAATLLGWVLLAALETKTSHARGVWVTGATAVFLVSLALPIAWATTAAAAAGLALIHLVVALVAIIGLTVGASRVGRASSPITAPINPVSPGTAPRPLRRYRPSRPVLAVAAAVVVACGIVAGLASTSSAEGTPGGTLGASNMSTPAPMGAGSWWSSGPGSATPWSSRTSWSVSRQAHSASMATSAHTEYFHVESIDVAGPGAIIITGIVNAGGKEHPGRAIDSATFDGGGFRIDHSSGRPTVAFDPNTCVGSIEQTGPFSVIDGTGRFSALSGNGRYVFHASYTTARSASGCTQVMTAYLETIDGAITLSPSAASLLSASAG